MEKEITFDSVMKNYKNWPDNIDFVAMEENYFKLKRIMNKMFFEEYPRHPQDFVRMFCQEDFADSLLNGMLFSGIRNLNKIWYREISEEDKIKLCKMNFVSSVTSLLGIKIVLFFRNNEDFFVNLVP